MSTMTATTAAGTPSVLGTLARQEIRNYLRSKLFWLGGGGVLALCVQEIVATDPATGSSAGDGLLPAAGLGLLGVSIMAGLVRRSDQAAAAAGAVGVPQRTRTLALAAAAVVPLVTALVWFVCAVVAFRVHPPAPHTVPFPGFGDAKVLANMFSEGVVPAVGGPMLGLVIGRWLPSRAAAPLISVVMVPITMLMQPLVSFAHTWHHVWPWTHFVAPFGVPGDANRYTASPGSVWFYIAYTSSLCVLGVVVAMYRDPEADRARLRRTIAVCAGVSVMLCALAIVVGPNERVINPLPSPHSVALRAS